MGNIVVEKKKSPYIELSFLFRLDLSGSYVHSDFKSETHFRVLWLGPHGSYLLSKYYFSAIKFVAMLTDPPKRLSPHANDILRRSNPLRLPDYQQNGLMIFIRFRQRLLPDQTQGLIAQASNRPECHVPDY